MTTTITKGKQRWWLLIWPEWYDDADDTGYCWAGEADSKEEALTFACAECDADNEHNEEEIESGIYERTDPKTVKVIEACPDTKTTVRDTIDAYNKALDEAGIAPNGDDFNDLQDALALALDGYVPTITVTQKGR